jgi:hypothetical protein
MPHQCLFHAGLPYFVLSIWISIEILDELVYFA